MKLPLKPICQAKDVRKDGTSIFFIQYCFIGEKRAVLSLKIAIPRISGQKAVSDKPEYAWDVWWCRWLKQNPSAKTWLGEEYIKAKKNKVSKATVNVSESMKRHLKAFETFRRKQIIFDSFDFDFYETYVDFLTFGCVQPRFKETIIGMKTNTVGKIGVDKICRLNSSSVIWRLKSCNGSK